MSPPIIGSSMYSYVNSQTFCPSLPSGCDSVATYGSTVYFGNSGTKTFYKITGSGSVPSPFPVTVSAAGTVYCIGITPDGSTLVLPEYTGGTNRKIFLIDTSSGAITTLTNATPSVYLSAIFGGLYVQNSTTIYCGESSGSGGLKGCVAKITFNLGNSTYSTVQWSTPAYVSTYYINGCTLVGSDNLTFPVNISGGSKELWFCSLSTGGAPTKYTITNSTGVTPVIPSNDIYSLTYCSNVNVSSVLYNILIIADDSNPVFVEEYVYSSGSTLDCISNLTLPPVGGTYQITASNVSGNATGNLRYYATIPGSYPYKFYNSTVGNGALGTSTGGDPHTTTLTGKSVIIVRDEPFLYVDTHPERRTLSDVDDGDIETYITCDCFSLKNDTDHFADKLPPKQVEELITNLDDSYLKYLNLSFSGGKKLRIEMISLLLEDEGESGGIGREQTNLGREREEEICYTSPLGVTERGSISFSKIEFFEPRTVELKSKYSRSHAYCKREVTIKAREYTLLLQLTRTECIHLSDVYLEIQGQRDPFSFCGVIVDGDVTTPDKFLE